MLTRRARETNEEPQTIVVSVDNWCIWLTVRTDAVRRLMDGFSSSGLRSGRLWVVKDSCLSLSLFQNWCSYWRFASLFTTFVAARLWLAASPARPPRRHSPAPSSHRRAPANRQRHQPPAASSIDSHSTLNQTEAAEAPPPRPCPAFIANLRGIWNNSISGPNSEGIPCTYSVPVILLHGATATHQVNERNAVIDGLYIWIADLSQLAIFGMTLRLIFSDLIHVCHPCEGRSAKKTWPENNKLIHQTLFTKSYKWVKLGYNQRVMNRTWNWALPISSNSIWRFWFWNWDFLRINTFRKKNVI